MESKTRFKLYKSGKLWCCAAIAFASLVMGTTAMTNRVHADVNPLATEQIQSSAVKQLTTTQKVNNAVGPDTTTSNNDVSANQGYLDGYQVTTDAKTGNTQLEANGWQASGQSNVQRYRYAILYDNTTNHEIARQAVTPQIRTDVQKVYPHVDNSLKSGFNVHFTLPHNVTGHTLTVVARYSTDAINGEGQHTDYWMAPIVIDSDNRASLDNLSSDTRGQLHVSGWHATNQALGKKYHYIIAYDQTMGREIARQIVKAGQNRTDVQKAFPGIKNAAKSGFTYTVDMGKLTYGHTYAIVSRYSSNADGNGNDGAHVDYWFNNALTFNEQAYSIDGVNFVEDVAKAVEAPENKGDDDKVNEPDTPKEQPKSDNKKDDDKSTSSSTTPKDDDNKVTDWPATTINMNKLHVMGWMASDASVNYQNAFVIVLDANNHELGRTQVTPQDRNDVEKVHPTIAKSGKSGFDIMITLSDDASKVAQDNGIKFVLRYTNDTAGNGPSIDQWTKVFHYNKNSNKFA